MTETTDDRPLLAGVMGWPVKQSRSPFLFGHWFEKYGISGAYVRLAVRPEDFEQVLCALPKAGFRGSNVTLPHKLAALALADEVTPAARAIGAANTMIFGADGRITAENTDGYGFIENVRAGAPQWAPSAAPALVLGAGGAARAILYVLLEAGVPEIRLANRTREKAEALAGHFGPRIKVADWSARNDAAAGAGLVVNTTSLGMTGKPPLDFTLAAAPRSAVVTDIVYAPLETGILAEARARGMATVDGLGMLLHQARPGFRAWFGQDAQVTSDLRKAVLEGRM